VSPGSALLATGAALGGLFFGTLPSAGTIVGTLPLPLQDSVLFTARSPALYALVVRPGRARSVTFLRIDRAGHVRRARVAFDEPGFLRDLSAGPHGIYAGTAVVRRFTRRPDQLVRLDARTLTVRARARFRASIATIASGQWLWGSIGDGRVVRLDPRTLATEVSRRILPANRTATGAATLSKPAVGLGSVWVLAGNALHLELVRLDPTTLAVRSRTRVPTGGRLAQALNHVTADSGHVYVVGDALAAVGVDGKLRERPVLVPGLANAVVYRKRLVGLTAEPPRLVMLAGNGRILARTALSDAGADLAVGGRDAWFLGNAGDGDGIVHIRITAR
jgi:hypothetical protein